MTKQTPQDRYQAKAMALITAKYKKEFVAKFKAACAYLGYTQSEVIRQAINATLEEMNMKKYDELMKIAMNLIDEAECIELIKNLDSVLTDDEIVSDKPVQEVAESFVEHPSMSRLSLADSYEELFKDYFQLRQDMGSCGQVTCFIADGADWSVEEYNQFYAFTKIIDDEIVKSIYLVK